MSFFTNDAYASLRQPPPAKHLRDDSRRLANASFSSTTSTSSMLSELDPLSPVNLAKAADLWYGNSHVTTSVTSAAPPPPKVFVGDDLEDEWGEFVNCSPTPVEPKSVATQRAKRVVSDGEEELSSAGWSRLPMGEHTEEDDDELEDDGGLLAYRPPPPLPQPQPQQQEPLSLVKTLLTRLGSFSSLSSPNTSPVASDSKRRGSFRSSPLPPPPPPPKRNYDSYDVTFEKGPIGLEMETDWYGRQAVVKGFKLVNNSDGLAKTCGLIRIGDVLTAINGECCLELGFQETLARLRTVSRGRHTLHFKSLEAAGDLSIYNQDADIILAKKFIHQHKEQFYRPPPVRHQLELGCVERLRGERVTAFNFHRQDTGQFIMAASCVNEKTGGFVFHTLQDSHLREWKDLPMNEDSAVFLGRLVPNFLGTEFILVDHQQKRRNELGFIEYNSNVLGRIPNFLKVAFPKQPHVTSEEDEESEQDTEQQAARPRAKTTGMGSNNAMFNTMMMDRNGTISERYKRVKQTRSHSLVERLRSFSLDDVEVQWDGQLSSWHDADDHRSQARAMRLKQLRTRGVHSKRDTLTPYGAVEQEDFDCDLVCFETRQPSWNEDLGAWTLNFQGRVKLASKKNFLIVPEQGNDAMEREFGEDTTYLRFGKVTRMTFALDYQAPLSPILALAIACSSFAHKIAVT